MDADEINKIRESVGGYLTGYLFSVEKSRYEEDLDNNVIPSDFMDKLNLSAGARLEGRKAGKWTLRDEKRAYSILSVKNLLSVSLIPRLTLSRLIIPGWKDLFEVGYGHAKDLDEKNFPGEWKQIFAKEGFPLSAQARVDRRSGKKKEWILRDRGHAYFIRPFKERLKISLYESGFEELIQYVRKASKMEGGDDLEFRVVVACCLLGPKDFELEGSVYKLLLAEIGKLDPDEQKTRVLELAIAFGCGKWRTANLRSQGWDGIWQGAFRALTMIIERPIAQVAKNFHIRPEGKDSEKEKDGGNLEAEQREADLKPGQWADATIIAHALIEPEKLRFSLGPRKEIKIQCLPGGMAIQLPLGTVPIEIDPGVKCVLMINGAGVLYLDGKESLQIPGGSRIIMESGDQETKIKLINGKGKSFRREARENITISGGGNRVEVSMRKCACGTAACARHHELARWDPKYSLHAFLSAAIKGIAGKDETEGEEAPRKEATDFKSGAFVQAMYYPLLAEFRQMRYGKVEFIRCSCIEKHPEEHRKPHKGRVCPHCGEAFDPKNMKRIGKDYLFFLERAVIIGKVSQSAGNAGIMWRSPKTIL